MPMSNQRSSSYRLCYNICHLCWHLCLGSSRKNFRLNTRKSVRKSILISVVGWKLTCSSIDRIWMKRQSMSKCHKCVQGHKLSCVNWRKTLRNLQKMLSIKVRSKKFSRMRKTLKMIIRSGRTLMMMISNLFKRQEHLSPWDNRRPSIKGTQRRIQVIKTLKCNNWTRW